MTAFEARVEAVQGEGLMSKTATEGLECFQSAAVAVPAASVRFGLPGRLAHVEASPVRLEARS
jgi:hypothetical protein